MAEVVPVVVHCGREKEKGLGGRFLSKFLLAGFADSSMIIRQCSLLPLMIKSSINQGFSLTETE